MTPQAQPTGYVDPIDREDLGRTAHNEASAEQKRRAPFPAGLEQAETDYVHAWRRQRGCNEPEVTSDKRVGLALSGGGIRSATFALGAMQALAARGLLEKFDYLSTVSGGGYIGGALTWLLSKEAQGDGVPGPDAPHFGLGRDNFPFGTDDPRPDAVRRADERQRRMLSYLREHGYYLTPGAGITAVSLLGIVLRGTFLNLIVWIPVYILFFLFGLWFFGHFNPGVEGMILLPMLMDLQGHAELFGFELFLWIGVLFLGLTVLGTLIYALLTGVRRENTMPGIARFWYASRRLVERLGGMLITAIVLFLLIGSLPAIGDHLKDSFKAVGPIAMLSGMAMAMRRFLTPQPNALRPGPDVMANLGAVLFLFGTLLVTYEIAFWLSFQELAILAVTVLMAFALVFGWLVNCNYISIHRFYRDRLMETFMPDIDRALDSKTGAALGADVARLNDVADPRNPRGPYHIINTNVVLADSRECVYRNRGGDSFILSPLYCGSNATGWCRTEDFCNGHMTLATAVAISGAAVNPNTGVGGTGLTRARLVSFVMALLNLRLGYWAGHPAPNKRPRHAPNHFRPGAYTAGNLLGLDLLGFNEHRSFLQLSDGGHFENIGVYELVRRRARLILVCDGGADGAFSFSDFQTTLRRIEQDFGVRIESLDDASPDFVVPAPAPTPMFPKDVGFSEQGHLVGCIIYPDDTRGWLIYLKATLTAAMSFKVKGYAAQHPEFPHQSTADQFFDDVQFEAYRELGYRLAADTLDAKIPESAVGEGLPYCSDAAMSTLADVVRASGA
jgi:hypothetical protein